MKKQLIVTLICALATAYVYSFEEDAVFYHRDKNTAVPKYYHPVRQEEAALQRSYDIKKRENADAIDKMNDSLDEDIEYYKLSYPHLKQFQVYSMILGSELWLQDYKAQLEKKYWESVDRILHKHYGRGVPVVSVKPSPYSKEAEQIQAKDIHDRHNWDKDIYLMQQKTPGLYYYQADNIKNCEYYLNKEKQRRAMQMHRKYSTEFRPGNIMNWLKSKFGYRVQ